VGEELRLEEGAQLRILAPPYVSYTVMPEAISRYREGYPNGRFSIELVTRSQIGQWISFHSFDIGIASLPFDAPSISVSPLAQVPTVVVMPPQHPLCNCDLIDVKMLASYDFIALNGFTLVRRQLDHVLSQAGVTLKIVGETDTGLNALQLVARGLGITIVDRLWVDAMPAGTVEFRSWTPGVTSAFGLIRPDSAAATAPTLLMTSILRDIFRERYCG
jgi:DNA-binding transcriptional LysR family regulator